MDFEQPVKLYSTIYSKSGCTKCRQMKQYLKEKKLPSKIVDCDDYLLENRDKFLQFMALYTDVEPLTFPIVFYDGAYIGGYQEAVVFLEKIISFASF